MIRVKFLVFLFIPLFCFLSCRRDSDVLATFDGGDVKRWELRLLFRLRFQTEGAKNAVLKQQYISLRDYALTKIGALEARKLGLDNSEEFRSRIALLDAQSKIAAYRIYLMDHAIDSKLNFVDIQYLFLSVASSSMASNFTEGKDIVQGDTADELLNKLNDPAMSDLSIEELIEQKTQKITTRAVRGYDLPICTSAGKNEQQFLTDALDTVPLKKFIKVVRKDGIWIVRKYKVSSIHTNEIQTYFEKTLRHRATLALNYIYRSTDPKDKEAVSQQIPTTEREINQKVQQYIQFYTDIKKNNSFDDTLNTLKKKKNFFMNPSFENELGILNAADNDWLFSINGKKFLYNELISIMPIISYTSTERALNLGTIVAYELLKDEKDFDAIIESEIFHFIKADNRNNLLTSLLAANSKSMDTFTEIQMKQWFEKYKNSLYRNKNFLESRTTIQMHLEQDRKLSNTQTGTRDFGSTWQGALMNKYNFKINKNELTAFKL